MTTVAERVVEIIRKHTLPGCWDELKNLNSGLQEDLVIDRTDWTEIVIDLEDEFNITLPASFALDDITTVANLIETVKTKIATKSKFYCNGHKRIEDGAPYRILGHTKFCQEYQECVNRLALYKRRFAKPKASILTAQLTDKVIELDKKCIDQQKLIDGLLTRVAALEDRTLSLVAYGRA